MRFTTVVTGSAYGTQQTSSAFQFAQTLVVEGHELSSVFFYREGVYNASQLTSPASDEFDLVRGWQQLNTQYGVVLNICVTAALHHGVVDEMEAEGPGFASSNLQPGFTLSRPDMLAEALLIRDRVVQF